MRNRFLTVTFVGILLSALAMTTTAASGMPHPNAEAGHQVPGYTHSSTDYVALGDSYTAGPLIPLIRLDPLGCVRSTANYPAFLAAYLHVRSYTDASCSAAQTRHMTEPQVTFAGTNPPQLDALSAGTDLVTLGIGGNDFGLFGEMITRCPAVRAQDPTGSPCKESFTVDGVDTKIGDAKLIQDRVASVLREIRARSPHAEVVVVGYLRIVPPHGTCPHVVPFADQDYRWANSVERRLNKSLKHAAHRNGATYVNMYPASSGHDACAGAEAWVNGQQLKPLRAFPYHPFMRGMRGIAGQIYKELTHEKPARLEPVEPSAPTMSRRQQNGLVTGLPRGLR